LIDSGKIAEGAKVLEEILAKDPRNDAALVELAMVQLLDFKQPDQALALMQRALEITPGNPVVISTVVSLFEEQGRSEEGLAYLKELNEKTPGHADLTYGMGQLLAISGKAQEAIPYMEKAAQSSVYQARAYRDLAEVYANSGSPEKSLEYYDKAIESQQRDLMAQAQGGSPPPHAEQNLGYMKADKARLLMQKGDLDQAQRLLDEASIVLPPEDPGLAQLRDQIKERRPGSPAFAAYPCQISTR
jgi:tetratricopeptide (TPR) repeat protein